MEGGVALDWDEANIAHIGRHGVTPDDVIQTFSNDAIDLNYEVVNGEDRWTSIGHTDKLRILVVVWTMRGEAIRAVTAFDAGAQVAAEYFRQRGW